MRGPAVDQHQVRPVAGPAFGVLLEGPRETARQHLPHHRVIVAGLELADPLVPLAVLDIADVELAVGALHEPFRPGHEPAADRLGTAGVRFVVDLDPYRRRRSEAHTSEN